MSRLILKDANLLDGDHPARRATIVVEGEHITSVGTGEPDPRDGDRVVSLAGRTVMPGMILGHYHAAYRELGSVPAPFGLDAPAALQAVRAAANLKLTLECGFTGVISAGAPFMIDACLKKAMAEATIVGPRMMACGRDVSSTGHSNDLTYPTFWKLGADDAMARCDGPEEFRRAVRREIKDGAEIIKVFATGGHGTPGGKTKWYVAPDELEMVIRTAGDHGGLVRAHLANRDAVLLAMDLGIHIVDHGDGFDDSCIDKALERGCFLAPSLLFPRTMMKVAPGSPYAESMRPEFEEMAAILPKINAAGVKLIIGDDYGAMGFPHGIYAEELSLYVKEVGIPALDVIRWATKNGAEAMLLGDQTGTIEAGKFADLLVIDGDPIADISILEDRTKICAILKGGAFVKDDLSAFERAGVAPNAARQGALV